MKVRAAQNPTDLLGSAVTLGELVDAVSLEDILGSFYALFRIPIRILNDHGTSLGKSRNPSALNEYLGELPRAGKLLRDMALMLRQRDPGEKGEFSHTAFTGASYHVAVIGHEGRRIGRFILGPFIRPDVTDLPSELLACDLQLDASRARELLLSLPRVREDTVKGIARHLAVTLDVLIFAGYKALLTESMHLSSVQENQRQLAEKAESLQAARERLAETGRLSSDFLATVSHELRAPLADILERCEVLMASIRPVAEQQDIVLGIQHKSKHLLTLAGCLADLSSVEGAAWVLHEVDVEVLLERVRTALQVMLPEGSPGLRVQCEQDLPRLLADGSRLARVLMLLGENALRFAEDGPIRLEARCFCEHEVPGGAEADGLVLLGSPPYVIEFRVIDTGPGISDAEKERVFDVSYQMQSKGQGRGCGVGPAIVKRLIEAQGGKVRVDDNPPRGAVFVVTLPLLGSP